MQKALKPCKKPGCPNLTRGVYCDEHKGVYVKGRDYRAENEGRIRNKLYDTARWKKLRTIQLRRSPLCEMCLQRGVIKQGAHVDHIKSSAAGGAFFDINNLQTLCHSCHSRKTVMLDGGFGNATTGRGRQKYREI